MDDIRADEPRTRSGEEKAGAASASTSLDRPWLDVDEAAAYLRVKRRTIYKLCAEFKLVYHECAGGRVFTKADLDTYVSCGRVDVFVGRKRRRRAA